MRRQSGFTIIELLIVAAIIAIIAAIAIPSLLNAQVSSVATPFKTHFGIDIYGYARAGVAPGAWLNADQKAIMQPYVSARIEALCSPPGERKPEAVAKPPAMDATAVQERLKNLDWQRGVIRDETTSENCKAAFHAARALGLGPVEVQP